MSALPTIIYPEFLTWLQGPGSFLVARKVIMLETSTMEGANADVESVILPSKTGTQGNEGIFRGDENVLYLNHSGDHMTL